MAIEKNVDADLLAIVDAIPESLDRRCSIGHADNRKLAANLLHAKNNHAAVRICESTVRLPQRIRKPAGCILAFSMDNLSLLYKPFNLSRRQFHGKSIPHSLAQRKRGFWKIEVFGRFEL